MIAPDPIAPTPPPVPAPDARAASRLTNATEPLQPTGQVVAAVAQAGNPLLFNREVSWLQFNQRVLDCAMDTTVPLLERVRYLAIYSSNLDEFFMKRIGGLHRQLATRVVEPSPDGMSPRQQLDAIHAMLLPQLDAHINCWLNDLQPALADQGVRLRTYDSLDEVERAAIDQFFLRQVFPILTPLAVDPGHPFPFISNLSKSIGVLLAAPTTGQADQSFVRIKMPENLPRWVPLPGNGLSADGMTNRYQFIPLEQVIGGNLAILFPGMAVQEWQVFRMTRNADIELDEDDADDLLELVELELRRRRLAAAVRLELPETMSPAMREFVIAGTEVEPRDVFTVRGPMDLDDLFAIANLDLPALRNKPWTPTIPPRLADEDVDIFSVIRGGDLFVHHPYESFAGSVERFVAEAVLDPRVLAIKMTLYRTSSESPFVSALIHAAEMGKQVAVLVEIKARFDEERNLELARRMEKAGVHVVYGIPGLKTHTKLTMIVRDEPEGLRTYCHVGTGNYNSKTATLYTDLGLFTCDPTITDDVIDLFHYLTGRSLKRDYRKLLIAPVNMRERFLAKIQREIDHAKAGRPARIIAKMNALQDPKIINTLYEASSAGVQIDLIVRGFCCLRAGVPGLSERIRVVSILGRFLEHSRIYYFQNDGDGEFFIGSADWMYRNLDYRVEAIAPISDPAARDRLRKLLDLCIADRGYAWELKDATWHRRRPDNGIPQPGLQESIMARFAKARPPV